MALGVGITYGKLLFCHEIPEESLDKKISTGDYNNMAVYDWFNCPFIADFVSLALHLPPITIDDIPCLHKRDLYTPDLLPADISVASENSVITLTNPYDSIRLLLQPYDYYNLPHEMNKYEHYHGRVKIWYCCSKHDDKTCNKNMGFYCSTCSDKDKKFDYCHGLSRINSEMRDCFVEHQHCTEQILSLLMCLSTLNTLLYLLN